MCELIRGVFRDALAGLPDDFLERFMDYLCAMGVLAADGTTKPAWEVLVNSAGSANARRRWGAMRRQDQDAPSHRDLLRNRRQP